MSEELSAVKHISIRLDERGLPKEVLKIVEKVQPEWNSANISFKVFNEGISNSLIGVCHNEDYENMLLVKVFGENTEQFVDRKMELRNFILLSSNGYIPPLVATFVNGFVYNYIPGDILTTVTVRDPAIYPLVATMLAKIHKLQYGPDVQKVSLLWDWLHLYTSLIPCDTNDLSVSYFPNGLKSLEEEVNFVQHSMRNVKCPVVFCHNDLLLANIIYDGKKVSFIDYEYSCYNYQPFDIANHFSEFAGVSDFDPSLYPDKEFQYKWLRCYLQEYLSVSEVNEKQVDALYSTVSRFHPLSHLFWSVWSFMQHFKSKVEFDYLKYANQRYKEYLNHKHKLLQDSCTDAVN